MDSTLGASTIAVEPAPDGEGTVATVCLALEVPPEAASRDAPGSPSEPTGGEPA